MNKLYTLSLKSEHPSVRADVMKNLVEDPNAVESFRPFLTEMKNSEKDTIVLKRMNELIS